MATTRTHALLGWLSLGLCLLVQYACFRSYVAREVAWGYPRMWDQASYLSQAYETHDVLRHEGARAAFASAWKARMPQGLLFPFEAVLLMRPMGASRLAALTLIFLHFALLQVVLVATLRRLVPGWTVPALGLGLLWSMRSQIWWGGLTDFRLDFMAMCLQGVWLALALRADTLARPRGAALAALAAVVAALSRHITFVYVAATLLAFVALEALVTRRRPAAPRAHARGALLVLAAVTLVLAPILWARRDLLRAYYWVGHVEDGTAMARRMGLLTWTDTLLYYPRSLVAHHAGATYLWIAGATLAVAAVVGWVNRRRLRSPPPSVEAGALGPAARLVACATLVPLAVLTLDLAKSPVVANGLMPGLTLLLLLPIVALARRGLATPLLGVLGASALVAGLAQQAALLRAPGPLNVERADSRAITALHDAIARASLDNAWRRPRVFVDRGGEHTVALNAEVLAYERYATLVMPRWTLRALPWDAPDQAQVQAALAKAQLAVVTRGAVPAALPAWASFDRTLAALHTSILAVCRRDFVRTARFRIRGSNVDLWVRPQAVIVEPRAREPDGSSWITREKGLIVEASAEVLRRRPRLRLDGRGRLERLAGRLPVVHAALLVSGRCARACPVEAAGAGSRYALRTDLDPSGLPQAGRVRVRFDFDTDLRQVLAAPTRVRLLRATPGEPALADELAASARGRPASLDE